MKETIFGFSQEGLIREQGRVLKVALPIEAIFLASVFADKFTELESDVIAVSESDILNEYPILNNSEHDFYILILSLASVGLISYSIQQANGEEICLIKKTPLFEELHSKDKT